MRAPLLAGLALLGLLALAAVPLLRQLPTARPQPIAIELLRSARSWGSEPLPAIGTTDVQLATAGDPAELSQDLLRRNAEAVTLAQAGDLMAAVDLLRAALLEAPDSELLQRNLREALIGAGYRAIERRDFPAATAALSEAQQMDARRADLALALADAYVQLDQRDLALDALLRAREAGVRHGEIDAWIERLQREVDAEWEFVRVVAGDFALDFDEAVPAETVDFIAAALVEAQGEVDRKLGFAPSEPVRAVLYAQQEFHRLTQTPDWTQGVFDGRIKIPLRGFDADDPALPGVLRHEYAHYVVATLSAKRCPVWLNEGIAMWAEEFDDERYTWSEERLLERRLVPFRQLEGSFARLSAPAAEGAYAQSYLAVRTLIDRHGARVMLALLRELAKGQAFAASFRRVYGIDLQRFEATMFADLAQVYGAVPP